MVLERVQKIIANAGYCSRRKAEELIVNKKVKVNGKTITIGDKADSQKDKIHVDGRLIELARRKYIAFNKPVDCLTTISDPSKKKTIFEYIKTRDRLIPVGRLDYKTEGLLLLTNDGEFANKVMHPRYEVVKEYEVLLDKPIDESDVDKIKRGILLEGETSKTAPAKVYVLDGRRRIIKIKIHEGRNRIIRRILAHLGYMPMRVIRTAVGPIKLGSLPRGKQRSLTGDEINYFLNR